MIRFMRLVRQTTPRKIILLPRLLAGVPLVVFSAMHFMNPQHFRAILTAGGVPMAEVNVWAASSAEMLGGLLLLTGFFARVGGLLGVATGYNSPDPTPNRSALARCSSTQIRSIISTASRRSDPKHAAEHPTSPAGAASRSVGAARIQHLGPNRVGCPVRPFL